MGLLVGIKVLKPNSLQISLENRVGLIVGILRAWSLRVCRFPELIDKDTAVCQRIVKRTNKIIVFVQYVGKLNDCARVSAKIKSSVKHETHNEKSNLSILTEHP